MIRNGLARLRASGAQFASHRSHRNRSRLPPPGHAPLLRSGLVTLSNRYRGLPRDRDRDPRLRAQVPTRAWSQTWLTRPYRDRHPRNQELQSWALADWFAAYLL